MTQEQHPITPPQSLINERKRKLQVGYDDDALFFARWGADQELEACINTILVHPGFENPELFVELLRAIRRPRPPSLKERGREALHNILAAVTINPGGRELDVLKEIVESLPD